MWHDPELAEQRTEWRKRGGQGKATLKRAAKRTPPGLQDVERMLYAAMGKVMTGAMEPAPANALANLARALILLTQRTELEQRLAMLEALMAGNERRRA